MDSTRLMGRQDVSVHQCLVWLIFDKITLDICSSARRIFDGAAVTTPFNRLRLENSTKLVCKQTNKFG